MTLPRAITIVLALLATATPVLSIPSPDWYQQQCPDPKKCRDGSSPQCRPGGNKCEYERCYDGTYAPCTVNGAGNQGAPQTTQCQDRKTCPNGQSPQCGAGRNKCDYEKCYDGWTWAPCVYATGAPPQQQWQPPNNQPPQQGQQYPPPSNGYPPQQQNNNYPPQQAGDYNATSCPAPCNIYYNYCDKTTAPTCIYPDPYVSQPRAACACRPGYKAAGYADADSSKQWRLPVRDQEHRVWVSEGVKCDLLCKGSGTGACKEVTLLGEHCLSGVP